MTEVINKSTNQLIDYTLHLADNTLILTQRNAAWCGHGPILEQDIAITNITLDLIGQSRNFYQYAAKLMNEKNTETSTTANEVTEDSLAYLRTERMFKNCLLNEQQNGDWAQTIIRQFFFSAYQYFLYEKLQHSGDEQLAGIAAKSFKEVTYHLTWSTEWVLRLGDGTEESHKRAQHAVNELWSYTGELFVAAPYDKEMIETGVAPDLQAIKELWMQKVTSVLSEATLIIPENTYMHTGGKTGTHTEELGYILTELQYLQRAYPGAKW